ncbi:hypothetical protein [Psychrobacillus sp. FSL K6-1464]|uniref:hypothetical protein n=1 Tax=Psychrobacillus sp. FSL K6-1464 TaxID=2921545 RepID=UPI0030FA16A6
MWVRFPLVAPIKHKKGSDVDGSKTEVLLIDYKQLIDFTDSMQKNNFKFVHQYIQKRVKKQKEGWEEECESFLKDAIELQERLNQYRKDYLKRFGSEQ